MTNPKSTPPEGERRKAERVPFEPLRVRLDGTREGILVDISETGALLIMSMSPPRDRKFALKIEYKDTVVQVQARVVRSEERRVQLESATLARKEFNVALEFLDLTPATATAVRHVIYGT